MIVQRRDQFAGRPVQRALMGGDDGGQARVSDGLAVADMEDLSAIVAVDVGLVVRDMARSLEFFRDAVGLPVVADLTRPIRPPPIDTISTSSS